MRICHVCSGHTADDGRVFHRACVSLAAAGYEVHLIARSRKSEPYIARGVTIHPVKQWRSRGERLSHRRTVAGIAARLKPDLFHVHEPELLGPVLARSQGRPVVWDVHESYLDVLMDRGWIPRRLRPLARMAWDVRERALVRRCAAVVAATDRVAARYERLHGTVVTVANYPDLSDLENLPPAAREDGVCVYAGTIVPNRGLSEVLEALAKLKERGSPARLLLAGNGSQDYLDELLAKARRLGVSSLVSYRGVLSREEALLLQRSASIGLVPGLPVGNNLAAVPVKMVECMALGLPVVFSDFPSHQEVAGRYQAGIAVDPTDPEQIAVAVERLVKNPRMAREMGEKGRRAVAERFNWGFERQKLLDLYRRLLRTSAA